MEFTEPFIKIEYSPISRYQWVRSAKLIINNVCYGVLEMYGHPFKYDINELVNGYPNVIDIYIHPHYTGRGYARSLIKALITNITMTEPNMKTSQNIYIESDITNGFWDYVGAISTNDEDYKKYDKVITFNNLKKFAFITKTNKDTINQDT